MDGQTVSVDEAMRAGQTFERILRNVESFILGKSGQIRLALICLAAEGHLLIDDYPGVGKTSLAKAITQSVRGTVSRVQFTPDLLPSDITGVQIWNSSTGGFDFHHGPVFANVVLADEINRASPKTQSALLEVMEERHVTVDGVLYEPPRPFIVIATQNPVELDGTYHLPEAQIDRFMMKIAIGYPDHAAEAQILRHRTTGIEVGHLRPVCTIEDVQAMIATARRVRIPGSVYDLIVSVAAATRQREHVRLGVSTRGALSLAQASQAFAVSQGRGLVTVDDVRAMAPYVLAHRLLLTADAELQGLHSRAIVDDIVASIPAPSEPAGV